MTDTTGRPHDPYTRRTFIHRGLAFASLASTTPAFLERSARAAWLPNDALVADRPGVPEEHVLVVVQLSGGNDGLNTVIPYGDSAYHRLRPQLRIAEPGSGENGARIIDERLGLALHPQMDPFRELLDEGVASIVQGVGYPNPNRSHFTSMDVWHTASPDASGNGWLGRFFDNQCSGAPDPLAAISIGNRAPRAMVGDDTQPVSFESSDRFRWTGTELHDALGDPYHDINRAGALEGSQGDAQLDFLTRTALDAQVSSEQIRAAVAKDPLVPYPRSPLSEQLRTVSAMIRSGLKTRVYYVSLGGFDTHANQAFAHARLLSQLAGALRAFHRDLKAQGNSGRVLTMVFSEFGRRVAQNASAGTDHGTAAPMYLMGDMVRPGILGDHPSLTDLDQGDLKFTVDFRNIYAGVLKHWLKADPRPVLKGHWEPAQLFA